MKTSVVILNYNTRDYLRQFLPGLIKSCKELDAQVVVADNASTDGSVAMMQAEFPQVPLIVLDRNYGFTGGYNRALEGIDAEYFVLINSDIEVPSGWLKPLVAWMDSHPSCGACGPKLLSYAQRDSFEYAGAAGGLVDRYGYPFCRGRVMQRIEKDNGQYDSPAEVLWASGACLMVRSGVWKALGGLDERFFAHMEEIDLCWRMQLRGWKVNIVPESFVYHIGGGTLPNESPFKLRLNFRNNLLLLENNLPATFVANGLPEARARRKTRRRIFVRMCLDGLSALVYLVTRRWVFYQAVVQAHKEYRQLRKPGEIPASPSLPDGLYPGWIVPKGLFK
ncbi:MAG: glycosyltransferase family 2 protein [Candidatus Cryptobacteroides sp.]|nr:glycosyltransferase family 2 protein [Candidatus Cryptobacteroides sp.]